MTPRLVRTIVAVVLTTASLVYAQAPAGPYPLLPPTSYAGATASSAQSPTYAPGKAMDGLSATMWHTAYQVTPRPAPPYWVLLDLGTLSWVDGLYYLPRQDTSTNGMIVDYTIAVSADAALWQEVTQGTFPTTTRAAQTVRFSAQQARYVRLTILRTAGNLTYGSAAEIGVYAVLDGSTPPPPPPPPSSTLTPPTGLVVSFD